MQVAVPEGMSRCSYAPGSLPSSRVCPSHAPCTGRAAALACASTPAAARSTWSSPGAAGLRCVSLGRHGDLSVGVGRHLRIDTRTAIIPAVAIRHFLAQPPKVEHTIHAGQNMILGHQLIERPGNEQFQLVASLASQHLVASQKRTQDMGTENHGCRTFQQPHDRQAPRPHPGPDHGSLCPPRAAFRARGGGASPKASRRTYCPRIPVRTSASRPGPEGGAPLHRRGSGRTLQALLFA